jgi:predicted Zn-dependent peptidase
MKVFNRQLKEAYNLVNINGLPVAFIEKPGLTKKVASISVQFGSIDLDFKPSEESEFISSPAGVAHFLEHQLFKKQSGNIMQDFARFGGYYNASTGYTATSYYFNCTDNFSENLNLLLRLVFEPYFYKEWVDKEKLIIEQELKMYLDMPDIRIIHNLMENLYHKHPIRIDIGGTVESIGKTTPEMLMQCYKTFYHPNNMVAVFAGNFDRGAVINQIEKYFKTKSDIKARNNDKIERKDFVEPGKINNLRTDVKMAVERPRIFIGYKDSETGLSGEKLIRQSIASDIVLDCIFGKSAKLYNRLYNDGLISERFAFGYDIHPSYGMTVIGGETDNPDELYEKILIGIKKARKERIKKRDIERTKRKYLGKFIRLFDAPENITGIFSYYHFNNLKIFDTFKYFKGVIAKDVAARFDKILDESQHAVSIIRPLK